MMKSSAVIVGTAVMIGFVSVLIYRIGASDVAGPTKASAQPEAVDAVSDDVPPVKVEFIVSQCSIDEPGGLLPEVFDLREAKEPARLSVASAEIAATGTQGAKIAAFVPEDEPAAGLESRAKGSPSFVFIQ